MQSVSVHIGVLAVGTDAAPTQVVTELAAAAGHEIVARATVSDTETAIRVQLQRWIDDRNIDVVIVSGGVESDHASRALAPLITQTLPGFTDLFRYLAFQEIGASAMLSNAEAAQCRTTFVFVLPAVTSAVRAAMEKLILPQLDPKTTPKNLVSSIPRMHGADAVPLPVVKEKTAGGSGFTPKMPAMPAARRDRPRTGANVIARKRDPAFDPPTKPIELAKLEQQIALSEGDAQTKEVDLSRLPRVPPGAEDTLDDGDHVGTGAGSRERRARLESEPAPPPPPVRPGQSTPARGAGVVPARVTPLARKAPHEPPAGPPARLHTEPAAPPPADTRDSALRGGSPSAKRWATEPARHAGAEHSTTDTADDDPTGRTRPAPPDERASTEPLPQPGTARRSPTQPPPSPPTPAKRAPTELPPLPVAARRTPTEPPPLPAKRSPTEPPPLPTKRPPTEPPPLPVAAKRPGTEPPPDIGALVAPPLSRSTGELPLGTFDYPEKKGRGKLVWALALVAAMCVGFAAVVFIFPKVTSRATPAAPSVVAAVPADAASVESPPPADANVAAVESDAAAIDAAAPEPEVAESRPTPAPPTRPRPTPDRDTDAVPVTKPADTGATSEPPADAGSSAEPPAEPPASPPAAPGCDEVACVLAKYDRPCCAKYRPKDSDLQPRTAEGIPAALDKMMVRDGIAKVKPRIVACGEQHTDKGTVTIKMSVRPDGTVESATVVDAPSTGLGECVAEAMRNATFGKSVGGGGFTYPFVF